jgi:hypothetical protein
MADKTVSQVQHDSSSQAQQGSAPQAAAASAQDAAKGATQAATAQARKMTEDHFARVAALQTEVARYEQQGVEQLLSAVDETARLTRAGLQWYLNVSTQTRQATMDAMRRTSALFTPAI